MILQDVWHVALGFSTGMPIEVEPVQEHLSTDKEYSNVMNKLSNPKYAGMDILTDQNTADALRKELQREATRAKAIGRKLQPKFAALQDAIDSGRLLKRLPCGAPLPTQDHITKVARNHAQKLFGVQTSKISTTVARSSKVIAGHADDIADGAMRISDRMSCHRVRSVRHDSSRGSVPLKDRSPAARS